MKGRPPKSDTLKRLDGNPGKRPIGQAENLNVPEADRTCPDDLKGKHARELWNRIVPQLPASLWTVTDVPLFFAACQEWQLYMQSREQLRKESLINSEGLANPAARIGNAALQNLGKIFGRFGMTPQDRRALRLNLTEAPVPDDELTKWRRTRAGARRAT